MRANEVFHVSSSKDRPCARTWAFEVSLSGRCSYQDVLRETQFGSDGMQSLPFYRRHEGSSFLTAGDVYRYRALSHAPKDLKAGGIRRIGQRKNLLCQSIHCAQSGVDIPRLHDDESFSRTKFLGTGGPAKDSGMQRDGRRRATPQEIGQVRETSPARDIILRETIDISCCKPPPHRMKLCCSPNPCRAQEEPAKAEMPRRASLGTGALISRQHEGFREIFDVVYLPLFLEVREVEKIRDDGHCKRSESARPLMLEKNPIVRIGHCQDVGLFFKTFHSVVVIGAVFTSKAVDSHSLP
jgi:hypothetical protein